MKQNKTKIMQSVGFEPTLLRACALGMTALVFEDHTLLLHVFCRFELVSFFGTSKKKQASFFSFFTNFKKSNLAFEPNPINLLIARTFKKNKYP